MLVLLSFYYSAHVLDLKPDIWMSIGCYTGMVTCYVTLYLWVKSGIKGTINHGPVSLAGIVIASVAYLVCLGLRVGFMQIALLIVATGLLVVPMIFVQREMVRALGGTAIIILCTLGWLPLAVASFYFLYR